MRISNALAALVAALWVMPAAAAAVDTVSLGHGLEAWYITNDTLPIVDVVLSFEGAGTASDPKGKEGRAAFAAAMLNEGAGDLDALGFARALQDKAISIDASASDDRLTVRVRCLREYAKDAGTLLAMELTQPHFAEEDIARVKKETLTQLSLLDESPDYLVTRAFDSRAFAGHPYANPPYGTKDSVAALTAEDLRAYLGASVTRRPLLITAAGDVNDAVLTDMLAPLTAALPEGVEAVPVAKATMQGAGTSVHEEHALPQSSILFAAPGVERSDKRFYAAYLLNQIIGGNGLVSRLAEAVRQDKGLAYGIGTDLEVKRGSSLIAGWSASGTATAGEVLARIKETLKSIADQGVRPQACEEAKTYVLGSFPLDMDGTNRLASMLLTMRIHGLGKDYLEKRDDYFKQVTCDEVNAVARELLPPERFFFVTVGETPAPKEQK